MPIVRDISIDIGMDQILRRQEIGARSKLRPEFGSILDELLASVNEFHLFDPAIAYEFHSLDEKVPGQVSVPMSAADDCFKVPSTLSKAAELAVVVCTIGPRLERKAADYSKKSEPLRALMLDGIGSAAVDSLAREACHLINQEASVRGYRTSSPISPGMPGLPISSQRYLFELVPADQIGVSLTSRQVMVPYKTLSMVIGVGNDMPTWTQAEVCAGCSLKKTCLHRVMPSHKSETYSIQENNATSY